MTDTGDGKESYRGCVKEVQSWEFVKVRFKKKRKINNFDQGKNTISTKKKKFKIFLFSFINSHLRRQGDAGPCNRPDETEDVWGTIRYRDDPLSKTSVFSI